MAQTGTPGPGPDLSTKITRFYGGTVDQAQPAFRLNAPGSNPGSCLLWNSPPTLAQTKGAPWRRVLTVWARVTTGAALKTRFPYIYYTDNAHNLFYHDDPTYAIGPNMSDIWIGAGIGYPPDGNPPPPRQGHSMPLLDVWLPPGCPFQFGLGEFDNGDTMLEARLMVEEAGPLLQGYTPPLHYLDESPPLS